MTILPTDTTEATFAKRVLWALGFSCCFFSTIAFRDYFWWLVPAVIPLGFLIAHSVSQIEKLETDNFRLNVEAARLQRDKELHVCGGSEAEYWKKQYEDYKRMYDGYMAQNSQVNWARRQLCGGPGTIGESMKLDPAPREEKDITPEPVDDGTALQLQQMAKAITKKLKEGGFEEGDIKAKLVIKNE